VLRARVDNDTVHRTLAVSAMATTEHSSSVLTLQSCELFGGCAFCCLVDYFIRNVSCFCLQMPVFPPYEVASSKVILVSPQLQAERTGQP
jgi:hypothetical protein